MDSEEDLGEIEAGSDGEKELENLLPPGVAILLKDEMRETPSSADSDPPMVKVTGGVTEGAGIALPTQIQHIIGRELDNPGLLTRLDLQSLPTQQYLEKTVIPIVMQGMVALCKERPADPIEYMAAYLLRHREKFKS